MAEERSDSSRYLSPSSNVWITPAQYMSEILCQRQSDKENGGKLPEFFWNIPKWNKIFKKNITQVNRLIKEFGEEALLVFIKSDKGKWMYSLGIKNVPELVADVKKQLDFKKKIEEQRKKPQDIEVKEVKVEPPRKPFKTNNMFSKLKDGDGKREGS